MLSSTENGRLQGLFKALSDFPVLFKAELIFKDFSRMPSKFKYFSSLCESCGYKRTKMAVNCSSEFKFLIFYAHVMLHISLF